MTSSRVIVHLDNLPLHRLQRRFRIGIMCVDGDQDINNITSNIALKSSGARAQKRNKTKSLIIFKSRGHTGVIIVADYGEVPMPREPVIFIWSYDVCEVEHLLH